MTVELSIVVPARDEVRNLASLVEEIERDVLGAGIEAELIVVDDGSVDDTPALLACLAGSRPFVRAFRLARSYGQSAALALGIRKSRGHFVAMLDGDGQNVPGDLVLLLAIVRSGEADLAQGTRVERRDSLAKKLSSWIGWAARRLILVDVTRDTGCSTRVLTRELALALPLDLQGLHRFVPLLARGFGKRVVEIPVGHRPRVAGRSKYGPLSRGLSGLVDCLGVRWYLRRRVVPPSDEIRPGGSE
jgi:dolichol-phosphate mannosyltransferase